MRAQTRGLPCRRIRYVGMAAFILICRAQTSFIRHVVSVDEHVKLNPNYMKLFGVSVIEWGGESIGLSTVVLFGSSLS